MEQALPRTHREAENGHLARLHEPRMRTATVPRHSKPALRDSPAASLDNSRIATGGTMKWVNDIVRSAGFALPFLAALALAGSAHAQAWPNKAIKWVVGFAPG